MVMANAPKGYLLLYELSTYVISVKIAVCDFVCSFLHYFILILILSGFLQNIIESLLLNCPFKRINKLKCALISLVTKRHT